MLAGHEGRPVVLGAVDELGLQGGEHLPIGDPDRFGPERADHVVHQVGLLHAQPQSFEVLQRAHLLGDDRLARDRHLARPLAILPREISAESPFEVAFTPCGLQILFSPRGIVHV